MSDNIFLLPEGCEHLSGGCALGEWVLAWCENEVFVWSLKSGWLRLPATYFPVASAWACPDGILVVCRDDEDEYIHVVLQFWPAGGDDWCWRTSPPGRWQKATPLCSVNDGYAVFLKPVAGSSLLTSFHIDNDSRFYSA